MNEQVHIIGGGISGLIAARVLEDHGLSPIIIEASDRVGGRLRTDKIDGHLLDHGFQVLLTAYPSLKKYLDLEALHLTKFLPGSIIFHQGKKSLLGDASRNSKFLWPTMRSNAATLSDKLKVWKLNKELQAKPLDRIFSEPEVTTLEYLQKKGFSTRIIERFFRPFYSGIFLENELSTSSRMFEFVFKMFAQGSASLPYDGIEAIPRQLQDRLKRTSFHFNKPIAEIREHEIEFKSGEVIAREYLINATNDPMLHSRNAPSAAPRHWKSCQTLYFKSSGRVIHQPIIGLIAFKDALINNICYSSRLYPHPDGEEMLSVTVVKEHHLGQDQLVKQVIKELREHCGIDTDIEFTKLYDIPQALPELNNLQYDLKPGSTQLDSHTFLTGDTMLNASLNGAMLAGEQAALDVLKAIQEKDLQ
ncbi:NAD(P)/FAD-dependent oxidoreductase [Aureitalea marina]|uniref:Amine oxidase domain-containing protein n=1 Tax=Aureitalea marina TaxID=930804 RepID=A0A2S7KSJ3_9FLAO|nr:NAD(P)/FAD-dependent oxidoreductase [Aureitalea marina]PQB05577.1 hypothetical protein BST85_12210 [Aureitalea marina]